MSNLSDIVNIAIELNQPVIDGASFDNLLIVGPGPKQSGCLLAESSTVQCVYCCTKAV